MYLSTKLLIAAIAVGLVGGFNVASGTPSETPPVTCEACVLVDDARTVLWGRRARMPVANASTTKMATALVVVQSSDLSDVVTVSRKAAATPLGGFPLTAGDRYTVEELLNALLLTSSNDAAVALAEHVAGSVGAFMTRVNRFVKRLDAHSTHFVTPHGLDAPGHYSTALDLATIGAEVLRHPELARIVRKGSVEIRTRDGKVLLENTNLLLKTYKGLIGIKTGMTVRAGNVLVGAAERQGRRLLAVAIRSANAFKDVRALLDYGFERVKSGLLLRAGARVGQVVFDPAGSVPVVAAKTVRGLRGPEQVRARFVPSRDIALPVVEGEPLGRVEVLSRGLVVSTVEGVAAEPLATPDSSLIGRALAGLLRLVYLAGRALGDI